MFEEFETEAFAAASIGQVYRARLRGRPAGRGQGAVPGHRDAVRADLQNMGLLMRVAKVLAPGMDPKAMAAGDPRAPHRGARLRARGSDAPALRAHLARPSVRRDPRRGHRAVAASACSSPSTSTGIGFEQVKELPQPERDRFGEIVFRFFLGSLYRTRHFSADPHPGNYILMEDGRVAFLDFGMTKKVSREQVEAELEVMRAGIEGDAERLRAALAAMGFFDPDDEVITAERVQEHFDAAAGWYRVDRDFTIDRDYVRQVMIDVSDPRSRFWDMMRRQTVPPDAMFARRMEALTLGGAGPARGDRELAPDRPRVAVRRPAGDGAGRGGGRLLRLGQPLGREPGGSRLATSGREQAAHLEQRCRSTWPARIDLGMGEPPGHEAGRGVPDRSAIVSSVLASGGIGGVGLDHPRPRSSNGNRS